jgi:hypothetical protein
MDEAGTRLDWRRPPEGLASIRELRELIGVHAEEPEQVVILGSTELRVRAAGYTRRRRGASPATPLSQRARSLMIRIVDPTHVSSVRRERSVR